MTDKFGYYFASGIKTYSKLEARQLGGVTFHFNDEVFSAIDTKREPNLSLWQLYMDRARQIREAYDYVVIMYSGGSDSNNVLDAFISAQCRIDEICSTWDYETTGLAQSFHNAEVFNVVLPRIKQLKEEGIDFRFRTVDITPLVIQAFTKLGTNFEYFTNYHMSPNNVAKFFLREHIKEWADMIAAGKKLALVWGCEKPIFHVNNQWAFSFADRLDNCVGPYTNKPGWYDEAFYWTPDKPEIVIKQAHVVRNFCNTVHEPWFYQNGHSECGYNKTLNKYLTYAGLKHVIYPTWQHSTFCNGKATSMIYSQRDNFFFNGNVHVERYHQIVDSYYNQIGDTTIKDKRFSLWPIYSRKYEI
jgi:hypothetical protein